MRIFIEDLDDPRIADYRNVPDPELMRHRGVFVAEGREVVRRLLSTDRLRTRSLLVTPTALQSLETDLARCATEPLVYISTPATLNLIVGFKIHRGCLALGERPLQPSLADVLQHAPATCMALLLQGVGNPDNMGGLFRNAHAFGAHTVILLPRCVDPFYRKSIRVSMGAVLSQPCVSVQDEPEACAALCAAGFQLVALTTKTDAVDIEGASRRPERRARVALMFGSEGDGLSPSMMAAADLRVRIPMAPGADSLNVAAAAAIALHRFAALTQSAQEDHR